MNVFVVRLLSRMLNFYRARGLSSPTQSKGFVLQYTVRSLNAAESKVPLRQVGALLGRSELSEAFFFSSFSSFLVVVCSLKGLTVTLGALFHRSHSICRKW